MVKQITSNNTNVGQPFRTIESQNIIHSDVDKINKEFGRT